MSSGFLPPYIIPGQEPGTTQAEREEIYKFLKWSRRGQVGQESCLAKTIISGTMGFGLGAVFSLMSSSFVYEDPLRRNPNFDSLNMPNKAGLMFKEMGRGMLSTGKGFGKVGALYAGLECCVESYRAKNDIWNSVVGGGVAGGILAWKSGFKPMIYGAIGFAAFSAAIDAYMRKESPDED
ncbi:Tim17/Tim22/Tim23/Pmp24 family-domain-containing protein [Phakopsora pachyrhizi]|uniref:Mitochondrial import inner membrane translocase subunit TIM22 n=1 Tax=Phakopsora pachyrhizi TaxID=170000 RepID=A0AAV0BB36_PHAPC|nr:Tim17/Tim22/Tim23/Pmp24 family-domain-containing protein [Phakopsora pachyrhizi]KAI8453684.1 Tim17/Tim22/Tim23/Pmp24 family-domain-containing protein [Phakopsora pachyrhizi]CAH7684353.1 Tim17/Tim22/Tim23/Pmp24 family-domain-containing protein [Phakopsora pachyrhizi]